MAGVGFAVLTRNFSEGRRSAACALLAVILFFEYRPLGRYAANSATVPEPLALSDAYPFLAAETDRGAVVEMPAADSGGYRTPMMARSAYGSAGHLRRVVATHGQAWPPLTIAILEDVEKLPDPAAVDHLRRYGCSRVVVHRTWLPNHRLDGQLAEMRKAGLPVVWESRETVVFSLTQ